MVYPLQSDPLEPNLEDLLLCLLSSLMRMMMDVVPLLQQRVGTWWSLRSLRTQTILWLYKLVSKVLSWCWVRLRQGLGQWISKNAPIKTWACVMRSTLAELGSSQTFLGCGAGISSTVRGSQGLVVAFIWQGIYLLLLLCGIYFSCN